MRPSTADADFVNVVFQGLQHSLVRAPEHPNLLLSSKDGAQIDYSDSDGVEAYLYEVICRAEDTSAGSPELMKQIRDWPTLYHLHADRVNLLRPLNDHLQGSVLEVGAGCGALSVYIAERAKLHVALEGTEKRARICAARCRNHSTTTVCAVNVQNFDTTLRFDTVLLVGVLEYSRLYVAGGNSAFTKLLDRVASFLKPDGVLILAIENRLGLKYFAGAPEDHAGSAFVGIEDSYEPGSFATFGRVELEVLLKASGLTKLEWRFPFPDYKFPKLIIHEATLGDLRIPIDELVASYSATDQANRHVRSFREELAWGPLVANGLLPDMANSFLVVCSLHGDQMRTRTRATDLVSLYATDRRPAFWKQTVLVKPRRGAAIQVKRSRIGHATGEDTDLDAPVRHVIMGEPFIEGVPYLRDLMTLARQTVDPVVVLQEWMIPWIEFLKDATTSVGPNAILPGDYVDCIPGNLIRTQEGIRYFDREWILEDGPELSFVAFRGLFWALYRVRTFAKWPTVTGKPIATVVADLLDHMGIVVDRDGMIEKESEFQVQVTGSAAQEYRTFMRACAFTQEEAPEIRLGRLRAENDAMKERYRSLQLAYDRLSQATAARIGMPHRGVRCVGYVDRVQPDHDGGLLVMGWALDTITMRGVSHLVLMVDNVPVASATPHIERLDVMQQMQTTDPCVGFVIRSPRACTLPLNSSTARVLAFSDSYLGDLAWT